MILHTTLLNAFETLPLRKSGDRSRATTVAKKEIDYSLSSFLLILTLKRARLFGSDWRPATSSPRLARGLSFRPETCRRANIESLKPKGVSKAADPQGAVFSCGISGGNRRSPGPNDNAWGHVLNVKCFSQDYFGLQPPPAAFTRNHHAADRTWTPYS